MQGAMYDCCELTWRTIERLVPEVMSCAALKNSADLKIEFRVPVVAHGASYFHGSE